MSVNARLAARAEAHGLERREGTRTVWALPGTGFALVWPTPQGQWTWAPPNKRGRGSNTPHYPTEETALSAALDWLDLQHPDRKLPEPSPGAQLAEVVEVLRKTRRCGMAPLPREHVEQALALLESLALPPASDERTTLLVAVDYLLTLGRLPEGTEDAAVALLRAHPELVGRARFAVWTVNEDRTIYLLWPLPLPNLQGPDWLAMVSLEDAAARWWDWEAHPREGQVPKRGEAAGDDAAREAAARALPQWVVLQTPASPPAEAAPEPAATIGSPVRCTRCLDTRRVSIGNLWGPFEDCPACRRAP